MLFGQPDLPGDPRRDDFFEDFTIRPFGRPPHVAAARIDPRLLGRPRMQHQIYNGNWDLGILVAVDEQHGRRSPADQALVLERHPGSEGEELLEGTGAIARGARRKEVEQILAGAERLGLPFGLEVMMDRPALDHHRLEAGALPNAELRRPVAARAPALNRRSPRLALRWCGHTIEHA